MSRFFHNAGRRLVQWFGYKKEDLPPEFKNAAETYVANGAVKKVGPIDRVEILHRNDGSSPVHQSAFNPADKAKILSARIWPTSGADPRTHHIYRDGTGTIKKGDKREYSTRSR